MEDSVADEEESTPEPENRDKKWSITIYTLERIEKNEEDNAAGGAPG